MNARFTVGGALALGCRTWFRGALRFLAIAVVLYLPNMVWVLARPIPGLADLVDHFYRFMFEQHVVLQSLVSGGYVLTALATGAIAHGTAVALGGRPVPIRHALKTAVLRFVPVVALGVLSTLLSSLIVAAVLWLESAVWLTSAGFWMSMAISSVLDAMLYLAIPVAVIERRGIFGSIGRSLSLTRGARLRVYALVLLIHILSWAGRQVIRYALAPDPRDHDGSYGTAIIMFGCVSLAFYLVFGSISMVINAAAYRKLRDAKEGPPADELASVFE